MTEALKGKHLVIYLPDLSGGGAERLHLHLAAEFIKAGLKVTLLLNQKKGVLIGRVPEGCEVVSLEVPRLLKALPQLTAFLKQVRPDWLISNMEHTHMLSLLARRNARVATKIIATQHISLLMQAKRNSWQFKIIPWLYRAFLKHADAIICVSGGVKEELLKVTGLPSSRIQVIYNGLVHEAADDRQGALAAHPVFDQGAPVLLSIGRLVPQKDHATLIRAMKDVQANLLILGEGPLHEDLQALAREIGVQDRVVFGGYVPDPKPYLRRSRLFVLSSAFEGFGNVIVEAMACGTPIVSTDCPYGPSEILDNGTYGALVPVADANAMSKAITAALQGTSDPATLRQRALTYSIEACAKTYLSLFDKLAEGKAA